MSAASWLVNLPLPPSQPPCQGVPSWYFDATHERDATKALMFCARCPFDVMAWCVQIVDPVKSKFDGVCGGRVYRDGRDVGGLDLEAAS